VRESRGNSLNKKQRLNEVKFIHNPSPNPNRFLQGVARLFFYVSLVCFFSNL